VPKSGLIMLRSMVQVHLAPPRKVQVRTEPTRHAVPESDLAPPKQRRQEIPLVEQLDRRSLRPQGKG